MECWNFRWKIFSVVLLTSIATICIYQNHLHFGRSVIMKRKKIPANDGNSSSLLTKMTVHQPQNIRSFRNLNLEQNKTNVNTFDNSILADIVEKMKLVHARRPTENRIVTVPGIKSKETPSVSPTIQINPHDFEYLINNENLCKTEKELKFLSFVYSAPTNFKKRQVLRETWANTKLFKTFDIRVVFLLAAHDDRKMQEVIVEESRQYGDIVQENFRDSYKNITYKGIMGLKWTNDFCSNAKYVFKTDDDIFLNIFRWLEMMDQQERKHRYIVGMCYNGNMPILRDHKTCMKWCAPESMFKGETFYPTYCAGAGYGISQDIIPVLYNISLATPYFFIEDVYMTGLLPSNLTDIKHIHADERYTLEVNQYIESQKINSTAPQAYITMADKNVFKTLWSLTLTNLSERDRAIINPDILKKYKL